MTPRVRGPISQAKRHAQEGHAQDASPEEIEVASFHNHGRRSEGGARKTFRSILWLFARTGDD